MKALALLLFPLAVGPGPRPEEAPEDLAAMYGFKSRELYELSVATFDLKCGDLNADGLGDLVVVDDRRARIEILLRLPAEAADFVDESMARDDPNQVQYDGRFAVHHHPVERRVEELALGDWNDDGRSDVGWVAEGGELSIRWSTKDGRGRVERRTIDELRAGCDLLETVDLDGDGRDDLLAAGPSTLLAFSAGVSGLGESRSLDVLEKGLDQAYVVDIDGDGRRDLVYTYLAADFPLRYRLGQTDGSFGPRIDVELPQLRSAHVADLDGDGRGEVLAVFRLSGRLSVLQLTPLDPGERALLRYPLREVPERADGERTFAVGDLDGDGADEVIAAEPATSEVSVFQGRRGARGRSSRRFPSLVGPAHPRLGDVDGDGRLELLLISSAERMLGLATLDEDGELPFPRTQPLEGEPAALDVADFDADGFADAILVVAQGEGRSKQHRLEVWLGSEQGLAGEPLAYPIEGLRKTPVAIRAADLDHDGALDVIVFLPGDGAVPTLLFQRGDTLVADARGEDAPGLGVLAGAHARNVSFGDVDGDGKPELFASTANFARALNLVIDEAGRATPSVAAQFNGPAADSRITACVLAELDGQAPSELVMRDERTKELLVFERGTTGPPQLRERVAADRLELSALESGDVDGDGLTDLVLFAQDHFAIFFASGREGTFTERASYDPPLQRTFLDRIATGHLHGDGVLDVVASELYEHALVLLAVSDSELRHALGFAVFEKKDLSDDSLVREPRELLCADIDGDSLDDVAVLVHDKLIVYLQE